MKAPTQNPPVQVIPFIAESAPDAVAQIRAKLGPDAVVVNVRQLPADGLAKLWKSPRIEVLAYKPDGKPAAVGIADPLSELKLELQAIRQQLASTVKVVASQRLLPDTQGGRVAALEVMVANPAIRNLIREQKTHQIDSTIQTSADQQMMLIENHLAQLLNQGVISQQVAMQYAFRPQELARQLGKNL